MKNYVVCFRNGSSRVVKAQSHQHTFTIFKGSGYSDTEQTLELLCNDDKVVGTFLLSEIVGWHTTHE